jgi:hypothetical protein
MVVGVIGKTLDAAFVSSKTKFPKLADKAKTLGKLPVNPRRYARVYGS